MRIQFYIFLLIFLCAASIHGIDFRFQVIYRGDNDTFYVGHSELVLLDRDARTEIFKGYTDKYGRITIELDHEALNFISTLRLSAKIKYRNETWLAHFDFVLQNHEVRRRVFLEKIIAKDEFP